MSNAIVIYPLYAIMFTERGGLSLSAVSTLFAIWTAAAMIFELPTGLIADRYPRKYVLIIGELINAGAFLVWLIAPFFVGYMSGFILWGAAYALKSGAYQALVYDELTSTGEAHEYTKMMARVRASEFSGMLLAFIVAYLLSIGGVKYNLLLVISALTAGASAGFLGLLPKVQNRLTDKIPESQPKLLLRAIKTVAKDAQIRIIIAWLAIVAGFIGWYEEYTPLFDTRAGVAVHYVPLVIAGALVLNIIASFIAPHFQANSRTAKGGLVLGSTFLIICATLGWWLPVIILSVHMGLILLRILRILLDAELQHAADPSIRATLGSVAGFASYPITIGVALMFAAMSQHLSDFLPFRWIGLILALCAVGLLVNTKNISSNKP